MNNRKEKGVRYEGDEGLFGGYMCTPSSPFFQLMHPMRTVLLHLYHVWWKKPC